VLTVDHPSLFATDSSHPVPDLGVIDINTVKKSGGSDLFIVIASPLCADRRSLERLLRKIELYLEFLGTDEFRSASGIPTPENTRIIVRIHPDSDTRAFDLLERNKRWVKSNNATLVIDNSPMSGH
jgi:hypothetical protein